MPNGNRAPVVLYSILFLFFFQLIADFVEAVYAFALGSTGLVMEVWTVLFLLSPVILLFFRKGLSGRPAVLAGAVMILCRALEPLLLTKGRMYVSGVGVACFLVLLPSLLWNVSRRKRHQDVPAFAIGVTAALALLILFRVLNSGLDISTWSGFQSIGWLLAAAAILLMMRFPEPGNETPSSSDSAADVGTVDGPRAGAWKVPGLCLGLMSVLVLIYFAFMSPNVIARWTAANYQLVVSLVVLSLWAFTLLLAPGRALPAVPSRRIIVAWNAVFVASMAATIRMNQVDLPGGPAAYPLDAPPATLLHQVPLVVMLISFPVILLDFLLFVREIVNAKASFRVLAGSFILASVFLLVMVFSHIFTTVYSYIPVVGPFFRDRFWCVYLAAGLVTAMPVLLVGREAAASVGALVKRGETRGWPMIVAGLGIAAIAGSFVTAARPAPQPDGKRTLRILTFNIQQGYSAQMVRNFDGQLDRVRQADPDIIGLEESDTNRIAGGNCDVVRYFADKLNLYSYYGPSPVTGTFGVALLSKYPIRDPRTFFMYSHTPQIRVTEQTAAVEAEIAVGGKTFHVFVTHLASGGPLIQQQQVLERVRGKADVILMGDFNFTPKEAPYPLTIGMLEDSWVLYGHGNVEGREVKPMNRIDHIFVSPGTTVKDSRYLTGPQSDHPAMTTEIEW
jgi:endonuclease/exonuclease/phosphatase family metal-dependent hydrolase